MNRVVGTWSRGVVGAAMGAVVGYAAFAWLASQGFYALVLPGAMLGLGCALLLRQNYPAAGILCGLAALPLGILCEWRAAPFLANRSLVYFLTHLHQLKPATWIMVLLGALFAFWLGKGSDRPASQSR